MPNTVPAADEGLPKRTWPPAEAAASVDPIFAAMREFKAAMRERCRIYDAIKDLAIKTEKIHGKEPSAQVDWRYKRGLGGNGIEMARDEFLKQRGADPEEIEKEYQHAKARAAAAWDAHRTWKTRTGVAAMEKLCGAVCRAEEKAAKRLATTKPTTAAGMAAPD